MSTIINSAELKAAGETAHLKSVMTAILRQCGGLPISPDDWSEAERTDICLQLLHEATGAVLRKVYALRAPLPGCNLNHSKAPQLERIISLTSRVDVNLASEDQLEPLPVIGPARAAQIVEEPRCNGPFYSGTELADRINGIGDFGAQRLNMVLDYGARGSNFSILNFL